MIRELFKSYFGEEPISMERLPIAGSNREYFRLRGADHCAIGVKGTSIDENMAFCSIAKHFRMKGINVPQLYIHSDDYLCYLQEDLGDQSLFSLLGQRNEDGTLAVEVRTLLHDVMSALPRIQFEGAKDFDFSVCYPQSAFDRRTVMWDLNYFKYNFLKAVNVEFQENLLEDDFEELVSMLLEESGEDTFLYRDFQSRNVMVKNGVPYFIDFQGGRKGPIYYDVASFLWQAKANFSTEMREELINTYLLALNKYREVNREAFMRRLWLFVFFRTLQVLGAYGYRGYFEKKSHFLVSIPYAVENLKDSLSKIDTSRIPHLCAVLKSLTSLSQLQQQEEPKELVVKIYSFSYRKNIPDDFSGNGGGYVFDCRSIHNPGRYEPYKKYDGTDEPVIRFLEDDGEIITFLDSVYKLVDAHVERYLKRGFKHLSVSFGCTGGRHRSVYAAQHLAEHLASKYPIRVELCHREMGKQYVWENGEAIN